MKLLVMIEMTTLSILRPASLCVKSQRRVLTTPWLRHSRRAFFGCTRLTALPAICFTEECQSLADRTSLVVMGIPLTVAGLWIAYLLRPIPQELLDKEEVFADPDTGVVFKAEDGDRPERDAKGELAFKAIGFTPWPVSTEEQGERIRIEVGPIDRMEPRTYVFRKILRFPSKLVVLTLPRPLGIIFGQDAERKCVIIRDIVPNSVAEQQQKVAKLSNAMEANAAIVGDVLRGITCTNFVYPTGALLGMRLPEKHRVVFGADGQPWRKCRTAFKDFEQDINVVLVLERPL